MAEREREREGRSNTNIHVHFCTLVLVQTCRSHELYLSEARHLLDVEVIDDGGEEVLGRGGGHLEGVNQLRVEHALVGRNEHEVADHLRPQRALGQSIDMPLNVPMREPAAAAVDGLGDPDQVELDVVNEAARVPEHSDDVVCSRQSGKLLAISSADVREAVLLILLVLVLVLVLLENWRWGE